MHCFSPSPARRLLHPGLPAKLPLAPVLQLSTTCLDKLVAGVPANETSLIRSELTACNITYSSAGSAATVTALVPVLVLLSSCLVMWLMQPL